MQYLFINYCLVNDIFENFSWLTFYYSKMLLIDKRVFKE